jgi:hypothetical protein
VQFCHPTGESIVCQQHVLPGLFQPLHNHRLLFVIVGEEGGTFLQLLDLGVDALDRMERVSIIKILNKL